MVTLVSKEKKGLKKQFTQSHFKYVPMLKLGCLYSIV